jgi:hypothetical protein
MSAEDKNLALEAELVELKATTAKLEAENKALSEGKSIVKKDDITFNYTDKEKNKSTYSFNYATFEIAGKAHAAEDAIKDKALLATIVAEYQGLITRIN